MFNARVETISEKPTFKNALKKRRCLIVADGFYEWQKLGKVKNPFYFHLKSGKSFGFAELYESWASPDQKQINTCDYHCRTQWIDKTHSWQNAGHCSERMWGVCSVIYLSPISFFCHWSYFDLSQNIFVLINIKYLIALGAQNMSNDIIFFVWIQSTIEERELKKME